MIIIGTNLLSENMISESTADMIADIGLHTFNPKFSNGMTINQMLRTPYEKWAIHSADSVSGYAKCVPLLQLLILAFQNESINYQDLYTKYKAGICSGIKTNSDLQINDFLYGIIYDYSHIKNSWNKFMENKLPFDDFSRKCDRLYEKRASNFNNQEVLEIMNDIADFANIKNEYNLRKGFITPQTNGSLRNDFNTLWNQLINTYNLFPNRTERSGPSFYD